jgi:hypothetical protein
MLVTAMTRKFLSGARIGVCPGATARYAVGKTHDEIGRLRQRND